MQKQWHGTPSWTIMTGRPLLLRLLPLTNKELCDITKVARGPSPFGHIAASTAAFDSSCRSRESCAVVTLANASQSEAKSSKSNPRTSVSTRAAMPASASCARKGVGCDKAPGPTPETGGVGAKRPSVCWNRTISHCSGPAHTDAAKRPPRRSTRAISRAAAARSTTYIRLNEASSTSKDLFVAGIASPRPS
jgi:hypothetical protein